MVTVILYIYASSLAQPMDGHFIAASIKDCMLFFWGPQFEVTGKHYNICLKLVGLHEVFCMLLFVWGPQFEVTGKHCKICVRFCGWFCIMLFKASHHMKQCLNFERLSWPEKNWSALPHERIGSGIQREHDVTREFCIQYLLKSYLGQNAINHTIYHSR